MNAHWPERCHGNDGVPERLRNTGERGAADVFLGVEHDGGEDDDGHRQREQQEAEFAGARLERIAEDPQTLRVTRELEDAEDAKHPQRDERAAQVLVVGDAQPDVVRQNGDHVDDAHHRPDVLAAQRRGVQSQQVLACEKHHARCVQTEQFRLVAFAAREFAPGARVDPARYRLGDIGKDRQRDEEASDVVENERRCARLWILKCSPHVLAWGRREILVHLHTLITMQLVSAPLDFDRQFLSAWARKCSTCRAFPSRPLHFRPSCSLSRVSVTKQCCSACEV